MLYYYSFLNIAKAGIVLTTPTLLGLNLEFNHGIDSCPVNSGNQLQDCYITVKNLINNAGVPQKISVAYEMARLFGDNLEFIVPNPPNHDNGPWKIDIISLLKSCIGIHRTVSETFKVKESFVRLESNVIEKEGRNITNKGVINCTVNDRSQLSSAGYNIEEID